MYMIYHAGDNAPSVLGLTLRQRLFLIYMIPQDPLFSQISPDI